MPDRDTLGRLAEILHGFRGDPVGYVYWAFPWDTDPNLQVVDYADPGGPTYEGLKPYAEKYQTRWGPDLWTLKMLERIAGKVEENRFDGSTAVPAIRELVASGHGIGKSATMGMLASWLLDTRPYAQGVATANTFTQLETKTWRQICYWKRKAITAPMWDIRDSGAILHRGAGKDWALTAQTCSPENADAFQGLHAVTSTAFFLYDEASGIDERIWTASEGAMTDGEPMWICFGNPTRRDTRMADIMLNQRHRWTVNQIDSRDVYITNKSQIAEWLADWGIDSDFARVRVYGELPRASAFQLISSEDVRAAREREPFYLPTDPLVVMADIARHGPCETVIGARRGRDAKTFPLRIERYTDDTMKIVGWIATYFDDLASKGEGWTPDIVVVDAVGLGWGVYDRLKQLRYPVITVNTQEKVREPVDDVRVANVGAAAWVRMRTWLKEAGSIHDDPVLAAQLESRQYTFDGDNRLKLTPKEQMIQKAISAPMSTEGQSPSPDRADWLALSFSVPIRPRPPKLSVRAVLEHAEQMREQQRQPARSGPTLSDQFGYDPFARF